MAKYSSPKMERLSRAVAKTGDEMIRVVDSGASAADQAAAPGARLQAGLRRRHRRIRRVHGED